MTEGQRVKVEQVMPERLPTCWVKIRRHNLSNQQPSYFKLRPLSDAVSTTGFVKRPHRHQTLSKADRIDIRLCQRPHRHQALSETGQINIGLFRGRIDTRRCQRPHRHQALSIAAFYTRDITRESQDILNTGIPSNRGILTI